MEIQNDFNGYPQLGYPLIIEWSSIKMEAVELH
jgi:hypothetical protein